jgi:PST family polysaccharide transporter
MLVETVGLFLFRSASGVYTFANSFILGMFAEARVVAYYGGAERLVRAGISLLDPLSQALYPRMSHLALNDPTRARRLVRISLLLMGTIGAVGGASLAFLAPVLVRLLLGAGYESVIPVLRVLAMLLPLIAVGTVLGVQWALPMGLDRPFYRIVVSAGILNVVLAIFLVPRYGALGMASSVVFTETFVVLGLLALTYQHRGRPRSTGAFQGCVDGNAPMHPFAATSTTQDA